MDAVDSGKNVQGTMRTFLLVLFLALGSPLLGQPVAPARVALVIGNSEYAGAMRLANPTIDSRNIARLLRGNGFQVIAIENGTSQEIRNGLRQLRSMTSDVTEGSISLIYFAGHGLSVNQLNYIIPIGAPIIVAANIETEAIPISELIEALPGNLAVSSFLIVDACRNVPIGLRDRGLSYGFARQDPPANTLISFSTGQGSEAADGAVAGSGSPFAVYLARELEYSPGIPAEDMFRAVRRAVQLDTEGAQIPVDYSTLTRDVSLNSNAASSRDRRTYYARNLIAGGELREGFHLALRSAEEGDVNAMRLVVDAYLMGTGTQQDTSQTLRWANQAARHGNDADRIYWADLVLHFGQPRNRVQEASDTLSRYADANDPEALYYMGHQFQRRGGTLQRNTPNADWVRAANYYERAAQLGQGAAAVNLGVFYQIGAGVPQNNHLAEHWFRVAAGAGILRGMTRLAGVLSTLGRGYRSEVEDSEAFYWYGRAASSGDPEAKYRLGLLNYFGIGTSQNQQLAIELLLQAQRADAEANGIPANISEIIEAVRSGDLEEPVWGPAEQ